MTVTNFSEIVSPLLKNFLIKLNREEDKISSPSFSTQSRKISQSPEKIDLSLDKENEN